MRAPKKQKKKGKSEDEKKGDKKAQKKDESEEENEDEQETEEKKGGKKVGESDLKSLTRISPLKNSPLISVIRQNPTNDFGVMARHMGDAVPYEHEFYGVILQGIFSLDLEQVGRFSSYHKTGFQNVPLSYGPENNLEL